MKLTYFLIAMPCICMLGCSTPQTQNIDMVNDQGKAVMALDYRDFDKAATDMVSSLIRSGTLNRQDNSRYVVTTGRILNDTMQRIDTNQLMAKIEEELMNSGQVVMTSAVGGQASSRDAMVHQMRDLRESEHADEFAEDTLPAKKQLIAPELSISGKIFQRNIMYDKNEQQVEYYFQLKITDITTGLRFWQKETVLGKRGSNKTVSW